MAFKIREGEQDYAFVPQIEHPEKNRYGKSIETVSKGDKLRDQSLNINGDNTVSDNPNRYKQHGFFFNADNCIACHACEAACSEKNDLPAHIAFRSVGYIEGGSYPSYHRMNISMACNHCDDPVCLKGCPTRAYTKFAEYGAVLQDPDICFGCGYCTWVCPYNAPQLDIKAGHVSKCNMCVDRLEVGLKPACAAACLGGALDFGITETKPKNRHQIETEIPGFPTTDITHPNIRFEQIKSMPREMKRTDAMPIRYEKDEQGEEGKYIAKVDDDGRGKQWNLAKLSTRENPLVIFTLVTQMVVGAFLVFFLAPQWGVNVLQAETTPLIWPVVMFALIGIQTLALVLSTLHLGRPHRFYRAFNNLRYSPVSREVFGVALFYNSLGAYVVLKGLPVLTHWLPESLIQLLNQTIPFFGWMAVITGIGALYFMHRIYRIKARPYWNHWQVFTSFYGTMLSLGGLFAGLVSAVVIEQKGGDYVPLLQILAPFIALGLFMEIMGLFFHRRDLIKQGGEGAAAYYLQNTDFGKTYFTRNIGLITGLSLVCFLALTGLHSLLAWFMTALIILITAIIGRALFYTLVVPTTMPGAFFWKNKGFEEHARETGLADMPQVGVVPLH